MADKFITVALGSRNSAGDWIVDDRVDTEIVAHTDCPQIVITPSVDGRHRGSYCLTHVQSGYFLLGGFEHIEDAQMAANKLASLFPVADWNTVGKINDAYKRPRVRELYSRLSIDDKLWMSRWGGPQVA